MKIIITLLAYLSLAQSLIYYSCPASEDIKPCECLLGKDERPYITCQKLKSADALVKATSNMKGYSITYFYLEKSPINVLPSDVFDDMEIDYISIKDCNLTMLGDSRTRPPFLGLENSLRYIEIKNSFVNKDAPLSSLSLSHLKKLISIHSDGNIMTTIGNNWFENGPYSLRQLYLLNTSSSIIGSHAFEALEDLESFALTEGSVSQITRDMFPMPAASLSYMDLSYNKLESLPDNIFSKMPSLGQVFLENNYLTTIKELTWAPVWGQLQYVYFHGNPIVCNIDLKWIYKYRLPENFAGYCAAPDKLRNRDLQLIKISDLE